MLNLMADPSDFGVVRRMTVTSAPGPGGTKLYVDGKAAGSRDRGPSVLDVDRIIVGARYFGFPPAIRGFLDGDILQVLVYDRVLDEAERRQVEDYLAARHGGKGSIVAPARPGAGKPLVAVAEPAARADAGAGLLGAGIAGRPDEHQQRQVSRRRQARRPGLCRRHRPAVRRRRRRRRGRDRCALLGEQREPRRADRHGADAAGVSPTATACSSPRRGRSRSSSTSTATARPTRRSSSPAAGRSCRTASMPGRGASTAPATSTSAWGRPTSPMPIKSTQPAGRRIDLKDEHGTIQTVSPDFSKREIIATGIRFPVGAGVQPPGRPVRDRPGRGDLAPQRQPVRRAAAHPARAALRLPAAAPEAPPVGDRRAERVRLWPAAPVDLRAELQRAGQRRPDLRPGALGRRRPRHRLLARQALPHEAGEDARPATSPRISSSPS